MTTNKPETRNVVFTVGNELRGDDSAGFLLALKLENEPIDGWEVIDGGSVPENHVYAVIRLKPDRVVLVDAADMALEPGQIRKVNEEDVAKQFLITTHAMPLSMLIDSMKESIPTVEFLGIQPADTSFMAPVTPAVKEAVDELYDWIKSGADILRYAPVNA